MAKVHQIKHFAIGVKNVDETLAYYVKYLGVTDAIVRDLPKAQTREAHFKLGGLEFQLCQSLPTDGRFNEFIGSRGGHEGVHHICYAVDSIDEALAEARANGATLKECRSCKVIGSHKHSEGWVAFLRDEVAGLEIEFMQVYKPGEGPDTTKREM